MADFYLSIRVVEVHGYGEKKDVGVSGVAAISNTGGKIVESVIDEKMSLSCAGGDIKESTINENISISNIGGRIIESVAEEI